MPVSSSFPPAVTTPLLSGPSSLAATQHPTQAAKPSTATSAIGAPTTVSIASASTAAAMGAPHANAAHAVPDQSVFTPSGLGPFVLNHPLTEPPRADRPRADTATQDQIQVVVAGLQRERGRVFAMFQIIAEHGGRGSALTAALRARPDLISASMLVDLRDSGLQRQFRIATTLRPELA